MKASTLLTTGVISWAISAVFGPEGMPAGGIQVVQAGFVTNSHCTSEQGGVESTKYWQPLQSLDGTSIGTEIADPDYAACSGIPGKVCRRSDSAFVELTVPDYVLGRIAKTTRTGPGVVAACLTMHLMRDLI